MRSRTRSRSRGPAAPAGAGFAGKGAVFAIVVIGKVNDISNGIQGLAVDRFPKRAPQSGVNNHLPGLSSSLLDNTAYQYKLAVMVVADNEQLWKRLDHAISHATSRRETLSELNRLLRKWNLGAPNDYISVEGSTVQQSWLTAKQLEAFCRGHSKVKPRPFEGPLVAVEFRGKTYMLDGTNRLNVWLRDGNTEAHEVIVLGRKEP